MQLRTFASPRSRRLLSVVLTVAISTGATGGARAELPAPDAQPAVAGLSKVASPTEVTLITGDVVSVTTLAGGRITIDVRPASRHDGRTVTFATVADGQHVYVVPSDAEPGFAAGLLDRRLFDVRYLLDFGYADRGAGSLPLIIQYDHVMSAATLTQRAQALPASDLASTLRSVNGAALRVDKRNAGELWTVIREELPPPQQRRVDAGDTPTALGARVGRVWLDGQATVDLDRSVSMIGAPQAWAAGYDGAGVRIAVLDTGIDAAHPDLAGKVVAGQSFLPGGSSFRDDHGHGTHVASTIAGSAAGSGGTYKGVAPAAALLVGKVCDDTGRCPESAVIAGMQWAASSGAKVVNMSLGGCCTDGTDPMSQAVNHLTESTGTLFVVAAGNDGPGPNTIGTPGTADAALAVAAVDKSDRLAVFSSRGPRLSDVAIKPDIAAPGVSIVAARAAGTSMGTPVDGSYTTASGTSMATPHVAGAAAILAQQHPDWTAPMLKAALMSTAKDDGYSVYEQGAGRVDVARAYRQGVYATTPSLSFGRIQPGQPPMTKTVSYRNLTDQPVSLNLASNLRSADGPVAPAGTLTISETTLTIPAQGTAQATVTLDPSKAPRGQYSGRLTAADTSTGVHLGTPIGYASLLHVRFHAEPPKNTSTSDFNTINYLWILTRVDVAAPPQILQSRPTADGWDVDRDLPPGTYSVSTFVNWIHPIDGLQTAMLLDPEFTVADTDTRVVLKASDAKRITVDVEGDATERFAGVIGYNRLPAGWPGAGGGLSLGLPGMYPVNYWVTPTEPVQTGTFKYISSWTLGQPPLTVTVESTGMELHPQYKYYDQTVPKLDGHRVVPVVNVHDGGRDIVERLDLRGKIALLHVPPTEAGGCLDGCAQGLPAVDRAAKAGAIAVLAYTDRGRPLMRQGPDQYASSLLGGQSQYAIPTATLPADEGAALAALTAKRTVRVSYRGTPVTRDAYHLVLNNRGTVPSNLGYQVRQSMFATVHTRYHAPYPSAEQSWATGLEPDDFVGFAGSVQGTSFLAPATINEHYGPISDDIVWSRAVAQWSAEEWPATTANGIQSNLTAIDIFDEAATTTEDWGSGPILPGAQVIPDDVLAHDTGAFWGSPFWGICQAGCRQGNIFYPNFLGVGEVANAYQEGNWLTNRVRPGSDIIHMYRDGKELPQRSVPGLGWPSYELPPERAQYVLTERFTLPYPVTGQRLQGAVDTTWTFTSGRPTTNTMRQDDYICIGTAFGSTDDCQADPLIFLRYQLNLDLTNRAKAPGTHRFHITAYRQPSSATGLPDIAGLMVWINYGDADWIRARVRPLGGGRFDIVVNHPPRRQRVSDTVAIRTKAWDTAGNEIEQRVETAYTLR